MERALLGLSERADEKPWRKTLKNYDLQILAEDHASHAARAQPTHATGPLAFPDAIYPTFAWA